MCRGARGGRVLAMANQKPGGVDRHGITREQADRAAWTIDTEGRRLEGAAAVNRVLAELGGLSAVVASAYMLRGVAAMEEAAYRWVAPRRSRLHRPGVRPECNEPGAGCA